MNDEEMQKELEVIKERNRRVGADKAWEVSWTRRISIAAITYVVAAFWLITIHDTNPLLKSFVPTVGYLLSTITLPSIKRWWVKKLDS